MKHRLANLLQLVALLSVAGVIAGLLGRLYYLLDLASHFRVQYAFALTVVGFGLWLLRRRRWSVASLAFAAALWLSLVPFLLPKETEGKGRYRLLTMNVLTSNPRKEEVVEYISSQDPDFVLVQEIDDRWLDALDQALSHSWPHRKPLARRDNFGVALYSKLPWDACEAIAYSQAAPTPSLSASFQLRDGNTLRIIVTHATPPMNSKYWHARNQLFQALAADVVSDPAASRTIVAGDLNCTPWSVWFADLLADSKLRNSAVGHWLAPTWNPFRIPIMGLPIDHVLTGSDVDVTRYKTGPFLGSDHRPVIVDFK